jgi:hypothetical protein
MTKATRSGFYFFAIAGSLLACGAETAYVDNTSTEPVECERQIDCYLNGNLEVGTDCINNQCVCHEPGEARLPCCKKGADPYDCDRKCRQADECADAPDASGSGGSAGGGGVGGEGGAGGMSGGECQTAADCPGPDDPECGEAKCDDGTCHIDFVPFSKVDSQTRGDCASVYCNGIGQRISLPDGEDSYNDGRQCTFDYCLASEMGQVIVINAPLPDGSLCPETGAGLCYEGGCVDCIATMPFPNDCGAGNACDDVFCVPGHCVNDAMDANLGETDEDCGGLCRRCSTGKGCLADSDCLDGVCMGGNCKPPSCSDGVTNDGETGIDCGGPPSCPRCPEGQGCDFSSDCASGVCWAGVCEAPKCTDGVQNGDETGIDCGGACAVACG